VAAPVSLVAGVVLVAVGGGYRTPLAVYAATLVAMFATSALYHRGRWSPAGTRLWKRLDHSMIFLAIAGGYTGYCAVALPSSLAAALAFSSAVAECPVLCRAGRGRRVRAGDLLRHGGVVALALLCTGGGVHLLGALAYATRRPNPLPSTFGFHEVFHACTVVAATCHYIGLWFALYS